MVTNVRQIHRNLALMLSNHHLRSNIQVCFNSKFLALSTGVRGNRLTFVTLLLLILPSFHMFRVTPKISDKCRRLVPLRDGLQQGKLPVQYCYCRYCWKWMIISWNSWSPGRNDHSCPTIWEDQIFPIIGIEIDNSNLLACIRCQTQNVSSDDCRDVE